MAPASSPESRPPISKRVNRLRMTHIVNDDIGAPPGKFENNCLAYPTVATGDDDDFAL
jgi:hypothetical protein